MSIKVCESLLVNRHSGNSLKYCFKISAKSIDIISVLIKWLFASSELFSIELLIILSMSIDVNVLFLSISSLKKFILCLEPLFRKIPMVFKEFWRKYFIIWIMACGKGWPWRWKLSFRGTPNTFLFLKTLVSRDFWWRFINLGTVLKSQNKIWLTLENVRLVLNGFLLEDVPTRLLWNKRIFFHQGCDSD